MDALSYLFGIVIMGFMSCCGFGIMIFDSNARSLGLFIGALSLIICFFFIAVFTGVKI